jgi:hypothetical protein
MHCFARTWAALLRLLCSARIWAGRSNRGRWLAGQRCCCWGMRPRPSWRCCRGTRTGGPGRCCGRLAGWSCCGDDPQGVDRSVRYMERSIHLATRGRRTRGRMDRSGNVGKKDARKDGLIDRGHISPFRMFWAIGIFASATYKSGRREYMVCCIWWRLRNRDMCGAYFWAYKFWICHILHHLECVCSKFHIKKLNSDVLFLGICWSCSTTQNLSRASQ